MRPRFNERVSAGISSLDRNLGREPIWVRHPGIGHAFYEGDLDEFAIYREALSEKQVRQLARRR